MIIMENQRSENNTSGSVVIMEKASERKTDRSKSKKTSSSKTNSRKIKSNFDDCDDLLPQMNS